MDSASNFFRFNSVLLNIVKGSTLHAGDLKGAVQEINRVATHSLGVERSSVWEYSSDRKSIHCIDLYIASEDEHSEGDELREEDFPGYFSAMEENRVIDAHDARSDPRTSDFTEAYLKPTGITSMLDAPVRFSGELIGVICLEHIGEMRHWSMDEIAYAGSLADLISHAVDAGERRRAEETLRESERRFRSLYEQSPIGISLEDYSSVKRFIDRLKSEGVSDFHAYFSSHEDELLEVISEIDVIQVNETQLAIFGVDSFEDYLEFDATRVAKDSLNWRKFYAEEFSAFALGEEQVSREVTDIRPDGSRFDLRCISRVVAGRESDWSEIITTHEDITARKEAQAAMERALLEAQNANRAKSEFLAAMSHELRTPLNAILGFSEVLTRQYFGPLGSKTYLDYVSDIYKSGQNLLDLINDVLDISSLESGRRPLSKEEIDVEEVLGDCVRSTVHGHRGKDVEVLLDLPSDLPRFRADEKMLVQIILNLLANSIKFTPEGGTVVLSAMPSEEFMTFVVKDTGIGIAPNDLAVITEPFARANSDAYVAQGGVGLGLSIVKSLAKAHDAELDIVSEPGIGTTVFIKFPHA